ncbi:alpha/beta fold hydrolase [Dongia soli]|uniref:Alpha/beta hydrolase n=1 Tax=Dongia soli TaxID=600628 RepID=A0ABU5EG40_9PROT|nr:alpha/beta hydrolase [Dongia soli]MDY0885373.1 alpha/beta hydrolase [Dongia soli]
MSDILTQSRPTQSRRDFMKKIATGGVAVAGAAAIGSSLAEVAQATNLPPSDKEGLGEVKQIRTGQLDVGYYEFGPRNGPVAILLHGFPYDVHSYVEVAPMLAGRGARVIVPYLRGHGSTRFLEKAAPRAGQQAAIGADVIDLMDALGLPKAVLAGYDWGGRAACVAAALWPERCKGLVSVNSYLIQDIAKAQAPLAPRVEWGLWYQFYFQTERGRAGLAANRKDIARILWANNSPNWAFDDATFERSAAAFDNPDYVDVVIHSYRHRLGSVEGVARYATLERRLAEQPVIHVPSITLDGAADGVVPATDGTASAAHFGGSRVHRVVPGVGHNLPQEAPGPFAAAVWELLSA